MTDEEKQPASNAGAKKIIKKIVVAQPKPAAPNPAAPNEAAVKAQEMGKKLTGFLGGLAEKAKNLDIKDLAEKAKNLDVKELTEKAKQKVNEVKDMAGEITAGKTENFASPREDVTPEQMKELAAKIQTALNEELPPVVEAVLSDTADGEKTEIKFKLTAETAVALTDKTLFYFVKTSDQYTAYIFPLSEIRCFSILTPRGENAGRFNVVIGNETVKMPVSGLESYCKILALYKKLRKARG